MAQTVVGRKLLKAAIARQLGQWTACGNGGHTLISCHWRCPHSVNVRCPALHLHHTMFIWELVSRLVLLLRVPAPCLPPPQTLSPPAIYQPLRALRTTVFSPGWGSFKRTAPFSSCACTRTLLRCSLAGAAAPPGAWDWVAPKPTGHSPRPAERSLCALPQQAPHAPSRPPAHPPTPAGVLMLRERLPCFTD